jgi:predicted nucleotidyltransferase component of viral defense system
MITRRRVEQVAAETGFRADAVEKVLRLCAILERLDRHPTTRGRWLLKGGTALNLLYLDVPRMSVDIDLNFTGAVDREEMLALRPEFESALGVVCERSGCTVRRTPGDHAGGKFRLRFASVLGGSQNLEVDVSYVARVPLLEPRRLATRFPPDEPVEVSTLALHELAAGKFAALMQRTVARDAFDAVKLLLLVPGLLEDPHFRLCFVCQMAGGRHDPREMLVRDVVPEVRAVEQQLLPMLRLGEGHDPPGTRALHRQLEHELAGVGAELLAWRPAERRFLDRLHDDGELDATLLHSDAVVQERVRSQPMLQWKALNVREHRQRR